MLGATVMMAARYGIARGLFSNESGLGSAPIVAAAAQTKNPVRQALISSTGTFWDTVVICAMTGLVLVSSILKHPDGFEGLNGASLTKMAFSTIPVVGPMVLIVGLFTFVFSTILGWSYYGEKAVEYLLGKKSILPYRIAWVAAVYVGSVQSLSLVWGFADAANALMAIPNIFCGFAAKSRHRRRNPQIPLERQYRPSRQITHKNTNVTVYCKWTTPCLRSATRVDFLMTS